MKPIAETVLTDYDWSESKTQPELRFEKRNHGYVGCMAIGGESVLEFDKDNILAQLYSMSELFRSAAEWLERETAIQNVRE